MKHVHRKQERGMLTVEAVLSLVPFILVILGIISFINIFQVHNKIQYAMFQMGSELSSYTYLYEALGIREGDITFQEDVENNTQEIKNLESKISKSAEDITNFIVEVESFGEEVGSIKSIKSYEDLESGMNNIQEAAGSVQQAGKNMAESGKETIEAGKEFLSDPQRMFSNIVFRALEHGSNGLRGMITDLVGTGLFKHYLDMSFAESSNLTADEFLKNYGVVGGLSGLDFTKSKLFTDDNHRMIDLVVEYDLEIHFFKLFLKDPTITIVQRCPVPAWLDGDGVHYDE